MDDAAGCAHAGLDVATLLLGSPDKLTRPAKRAGLNA